MHKNNQKNTRTIKKRQLKSVLAKLLVSEVAIQKRIDKFLKECKQTAFPKTTGPIISVKNLFKSFYAHRSERIILKNITFDINCGDCISLLGNNGAGKTTLVHCLCTLLKPTNGGIEYLYHYKKKPTESMGIMFQQNVFIPSFTVWDYIQFVLSIYESNISIENLALLLTVLKLGDKLNDRANQLSGGEKQRLNLLLSFICNPMILIIDEFTNNLDQATKKRLISFIHAYVKAKNITLLFVSHDPVEVSVLANKIMIINDGSIQRYDTYAKVLKNYKDIYHLIGELV
ncbi:MAG: ABC transporter ATP-binding protein [Mycoplasmataceae bacterium]|nr:ABC transporter ATP-binding protein [Mycoplasmataceae bacterium]